MKILCIDDVESNRVLIYSQLKLIKVESVTAVSARDGVLRLLQDPEITAIFMDIMMPNVNGFNATVAIRHLGFKIPIVALTSVTETLEMQLESMAKGIDEYLERPIKPSKLVEVLRRLHPNEQIENSGYFGQKDEIL
ncbi:MAG TPA: response regulator [Drouetiella sp.]